MGNKHEWSRTDLGNKYARDKTRPKHPTSAHQWTISRERGITEYV